MAVELPSLTTPRLAGAWEVAGTTLNIPHPYPEGGGVDWIETHTAAWEDGTSLTLAIALRATPETVIGAVSLAIAPEHSRGELGYWIAAAEWPADSIRLDAYDADAGAGWFYAKCGFQERGRVVYKGDPLVYYEFLLT